MADPCDIDPPPPHFLPSNPNCHLAGAKQKDPGLPSLKASDLALCFLWHTAVQLRKLSTVATENQIHEAGSFQIVCEGGKVTIGL